MSLDDYFGDYAEIDNDDRISLEPTTENYLTNIIRSKEPIFEEIKFTRIKFEENVSYSDKSRIARNIQKEHNIICLHNVKDLGLIGALSTEKIEKVLVSTLRSCGFEIDFEIEKTQTIKSKENSKNGILLRLSYILRRRFLANLGYTSRSGNKYFKEDEFSKHETIRIHDGIKVGSFIDENGHFYLSIDPASKWILFLDEAVKMVDDVYDIVGKKAQVYFVNSEKWGTGVISKINTNGMNNYIPKIEKKIKDLWNEDRYKEFLSSWNLDITNNQTTVEVVMDWDEPTPLEYPLPTVRLVIDLEDSDFDFSGFSGNKIKRYEETKTIHKNIKNSSITYLGYIIQFSDNLLNLTELKKLSWLSGRFDIPLIEFGNEIKIRPKTGIDNKKALEKGGPYSGPKNITINAIVPSFLDSKNIENLIDDILDRVNPSRSYSLKLGMWQKGSIIKLEDYKSVQNHLDIKQLNDQDIPAVIVIGYSKGKFGIDHVKKICDEYGVVSKGMHIKTNNKLQSSKFRRRLRDQYALSIFNRSHIENEATSILSEGLNYTGEDEKQDYIPLILTMDISRNPHTKKTHSATITVLDKYGNIVGTTNKFDFKENYFEKDEVEKWIKSVVPKINSYSAKLYGKPANLFIYLQDGTLRSDMVEALTQGIDQAMSKVIKNKKFNFRYLVGEVTKRVPERMFSKNGGNPEIGVLLKSPNNTMWLTCSNPSERIGHPQLLRIKLKFDSDYGVEIPEHLHVNFGRIIHQLRYINTSTPYHFTRDPYPKYLAHVRSNLYRRGLDPSYFYH